MTLSINRGLFIFLLFTSASLFAAAKLECPLCGMYFKDSARTSFQTTHQGKPLPLCSFSCANKFSKRTDGASFSVLDFATGKSVPAADSYFLIRSKKLLKELDFDMPPTVVAFADKKSAEAKKNSLGEGEVIHGWNELKKTLSE